MRINSACGNSSFLRIFSHTQRMKWTSNPNKNCLLNNKVLCRFNEPIERIICTYSNLKTYKYEIQEKEQESFDLQDSFLKENFKIADSRYFKLITLSKECNNLDEILGSNELKYILSRSSFLYDVNVIESYRFTYSHISTLHPRDFEFQSCIGNYLTNKLPVCECNKVFIQNSESINNKTGKPSEEQLLQIIDKLTDTLINFFEKPHDYTIYHENIIFQNNIKGVAIKGLKPYIQSMYLLRFYGYLHFAKVKVELLKITHHIEDGSIRVRWRVNGLPRHKLLILLLHYKSVNWKELPKTETEWLDGFSVFSVGPDGLIFKHICDKMIPDDDLLLAKKVDLKSKVLGLLGLTPRGPPAGTLSALLSCCKSQDLISAKKLT